MLNPTAHPKERLTSRLMADVTECHHATIARIWRAHGLRPQRDKLFKLSTAPAFVTQLRDVVVLYPTRRTRRFVRR